MCHGIGVCSCGLFNRQMTSSHDLCCYLDSSVLFNHLTATVITAFATDCVIYVPRAAVRAKCDCRHLSLVVSTALRSARLRLFAFRMCHRFFISYLLLFFSGLQAGLFYSFIRQSPAQSSRLPSSLSLSHLGSVACMALSLCPSISMLSPRVSSSPTMAGRPPRCFFSKALIVRLHLPSG